jgi:uncharacterized membrane protein YpjA
MNALVTFCDGMLRWVFRQLNAVPALFWLAMGADLLGFVVGGVIWYGPQLAAAPLWAWLFIPDCPLAALYGMIAFIRLRQGKPGDWFTTLAAVSSLKYGVWTVLFWGTKWAATGDYQPLEIGLVVTHIALAGQGAMLLPWLTPVRTRVRMLVVGWLALSVVVDYGFGHHPGLVAPITPALAGSWAAVLTVLLAAVLLLVYRPTTGATTARPAGSS